ncbi:unnamed protein product [Pleuronectes platessa]|uniref:Uncharacterized protein n=1 Tax=Pleuronectes platessa TaxID=8262 RepID=A0A9N7URA9_PLEPL|nr:unnamed protein product [Pleuronectes platessa]
MEELEASEGGMEELGASEGGMEELETSEGGMKELEISEGGMEELGASEGGMEDLGASEGGMEELEASEGGMEELGASEGGMEELGGDPDHSSTRRSQLLVFISAPRVFRLDLDVRLHGSRPDDTQLCLACGFLSSGVREKRVGYIKDEGGMKKGRSEGGMR